MSSVPFLSLYPEVQLTSQNWLHPLKPDILYLYLSICALVRVPCFILKYQFHLSVLLLAWTLHQFGWAIFYTSELQLSGAFTYLPLLRMASYTVSLIWYFLYHSHHNDGKYVNNPNSTDWIIKVPFLTRNCDEIDVFRTGLKLRLLLEHKLFRISMETIRFL